MTFSSRKSKKSHIQQVLNSVFFFFFFNNLLLNGLEGVGKPCLSFDVDHSLGTKETFTDDAAEKALSEENWIVTENEVESLRPEVIELE